MTKAKAIKKLGWARENLTFWREKYVEYKRDTRSMMDTKLNVCGGKTPREKFIEEAIQNINEAKEAIARYERVAR